MKLSSFLSKKIGGLKTIVWICVIFSLLSLYHFFSKKLFYIGSDTFYYLGLAESFIKTGKMQDITTVPPGSISSPQLGIVFIFSFLRLLNLSPDAILKIVSFFYYFIYVVSFYPIMKISQLINFSKIQTQLLAIAYYSHWVIYRLQIIPINDGFFNVIVLWLIYFIISHFQSGKKHFIPVILLSIIAPYFRLSSFIVLLVAMIVAFLSKKWKIFLWYLTIFCISFVLFKFFLTANIFSGNNQSVVNIDTNITYYNHKVEIKVAKPLLIVRDLKLLLLERIPRLYLMEFQNRLSFLNWGYILFVFPPLYYLFRGIKKKQMVAFYLSSIITSTYCFVIYINIVSHRYFLFTYILSLMLFIKFFYKNYFGKLLILGYIALLPIFSIYSLFVNNAENCLPTILKQLKEKNIVLEQNSLLFSALPRHSYFFLKFPTKSGPLTGKDLDNMHIYIVNEDDQIKSFIAQYAESTGSKIFFKPLFKLKHSTSSCSFGEFSKI